MPSNRKKASASADSHALDAARQRRYYIDLANAHWAWQEIKASWALEGLHVTDDNAERAGRMIAGEVSYSQISEELRRQWSDVSTDERQSTHSEMVEAVSECRNRPWSLNRAPGKLNPYTDHRAFLSI